MRIFPSHGYTDAISVSDPRETISLNKGTLKVMSEALDLIQSKSTWEFSEEMFSLAKDYKYRYMVHHLFIIL